MGHHVDGQSHGIAQLGDEFVELGGADRIEPGSRLVEENDLRIERQRARKCRSLDHAARQLRRKFRGGIARQSDQLDLELGQFVHQRLRQVEIFAHRHLHVLLHRERRKQRALLEQHAVARVQPQPFLLARLVEVDAEQLDRARLLAVEAEHRPQQHRLAGARRADEAQDLAAPDVERQVVEDLLAAANATVTSRTESTIIVRGWRRRGCVRLASGGRVTRHQKSIAA